MTGEEYQMTQDQIVLLAGLVRPLPLADFLQAIDRANSIGPFVDPTLWMKGHAKLEEVKQLAEGLRKFQRAVEEVSKKVGVVANDS